MGKLQIITANKVKDYIVFMFYFQGVFLYQVKWVFLHPGRVHQRKRAKWDTKDSIGRERDSREAEVNAEREEFIQHATG